MTDRHRQTDIWTKPTDRHDDNVHNTSIGLASCGKKNLWSRPIAISLTRSSVVAVHGLVDLFSFSSLFLLIADDALAFDYCVPPRSLQSIYGPIINSN